MKNLKMRIRLFIAFFTVDVMMLVILIAGYLTVSKLAKAADKMNFLRNYAIFAAILYVVVILIMTYIIFAILKSLRVATTRLGQTADKISVGDLDVDLENYNNDEFASIFEDYKKIVANIKEQSAILEEVSNGNLTVVVVPKSDKDVMGHSIEKLVSGTHHALSNIHDAAFQVMTSSSEVASASEALAQGSTEQASAIEQITASIDDISDKTKENASNANEAADLMSEAIVDVNKGNQRMQEMVTAMQEINAASESISKIIKVIDDIAFQTNILALNAAVEAARAGEAGMGFAVVAEEVRNLAAKSATAAAETAEMIEDSIRKVHTGTALADETAKALAVVSEVVTKSEEIVRGIASSSNYQATAIEQIDQAIGQVSQVVQSNSSTSEECAAASMELSDQAKRMQDLTSIYEFGNAEAKVTKSSRAVSQSYAGTSDHNESIISLRDGFGKY